MLFHYFMMLLAHGHKTYTIRSGFSCYWETASKHRLELEFACGLRCCVSNVFLIFFARWEMFTLLQGSTNVFLFAEDNLVYVSFTLLFLINNFFFRTKVFGRLQSLNFELSNSQRGDCGLVGISFPWYWLHENDFFKHTSNLHNQNFKDIGGRRPTLKFQSLGDGCLLGNTLCYVPSCKCTNI